MAFSLKIDIPSAWQSLDSKVREDLRKIRVVLERLKRAVEELQAQVDAGGGGVGTITDVDSVDGSITVTDPAGPSVDLAINEAELENGGGHEISVAGLSGVLADPQKIEVAQAGTLVGTRDRINIIDGAGITTTVADDAGNDRVNITIANASLGEWWVPPASAHDDDDEFTGSSLDAQWTVYDSSFNVATLEGACAFDSGPTAVTKYLASFNDRRSWVHIQPGGTSMYVMRRLTLPAVNSTVRWAARFACPIPASVSGNTSIQSSLIICGDDTSGGGHKPTLTLGGSNNFAAIGWRATGANSVSIHANWNFNGTGTDHFGPNVDSGSQQDCEFIIAHSVALSSNACQLYAHSGLMHYFGAQQLAFDAGEEVWIGWRMFNVGGSSNYMTSAASTPMYGCDYIRQVDGIADLRT